MWCAWIKSNYRLQCICPLGPPRVKPVVSVWSQSDWRNSYPYRVQSSHCSFLFGHLINEWSNFAFHRETCCMTHSVCGAIWEVRSRVWVTAPWGRHVVSSCPPFCDSASRLWITCFYPSWTELCFDQSGAKNTSTAFTWYLDGHFIFSKARQAFVILMPWWLVTCSANIWNQIKAAGSVSCETEQFVHVLGNTLHTAGGFYGSAA